MDEKRRIASPSSSAAFRNLNAEDRHLALSSLLFEGLGFLFGS
jgi:hypothetical protein